ncbi:MAG: hypothetical protein GH142_05595 [Dehalococcoidia bacterium]|nr:hypothetical protein [Dehalococcoidia bacterium]
MREVRPAYGGVNWESVNEERTAEAQMLLQPRRQGRKGEKVAVAVGSGQQAGSEGRRAGCCSG